MSDRIEILLRHDASHLPRGGTGRESSVWLGVALLVAIEATVVFSLITTYFYFRVMADAGWPPPGFPLPEPWPSAIGTSILGGSVGAGWLAVRSAERRRMVGVRTALGVGVLMLAVYVSLSTHSLMSLRFDWTRQVYASLVWTINGYQYFHALSLLGLCLTMLGLGWHGRFSGANRAPLEAVLLYWTFVAVSSVATYVTVYVSPYAM